MAGPGVKGSKILLAQQELIARASGVSEKDILDFKRLNKSIYDVIEKEVNNPHLNDSVSILISKASNRSVPEEMIKQQTNQLTSPWMKFFLNYDPVIALKNVKCPVLAICGEKDLQVPAKMNLRAIDSCFAINNFADNIAVTRNNKDVTTIEIEGVNHLFQKAETGLPMEYSKIEETISPRVLFIISDWIVKKTAK